MTQENAAVDAQVQELKNILEEDYDALTSKGDKVDTDLGDYVTVDVESLGSGRWHENFQCVTRIPDGRHFSWNYASGLTEYQDSMSPSEFTSDYLTEVHPVEEVVVVTKWVKGPAAS